MTVLVGGVVVTVATCGAASPAAAGAAAGVGSAVLGSAGTAATTAAAVATSATAGAATGAVAGAIAGGTGAAALTGAGAGAATGAAAAAGYTAATAGVSTAVSTGASTACILSGPVGWIVLGVTTGDQSADDCRSVHHYYTYDCWKAIVRDTSAQPSTGRLLKDVLRDSRVLNYTFEYRQGGQGADNDDYVTGITVENVWHDQFYINFLNVSGHGLTGHANKI